jgi:DEAD/DEAH box helicase domain-containing protein
MIPAIVADELRETLLDYLDTTFSFQDQTVAEALQQFLSDPKHGIFKGPFIRLQLPFRRAKPNEARAILEIAPSFVPYLHQITAFGRLTSKDNHQPQHTLVTTGTGSGKTECFLYPVLDDCYRRAGQPGIKAILLYPMNALAADQARRLAKEIWNEPRLKGRVTAGLYIGGDGDHKVMGPDFLITDRDTLRKHPPDILLTNYKMLDFLMIRPEDGKLWKDTAPDSVRYIVLDELHTYDGAQGSDVACLLRRLRAKLRLKPGSFCCVGTSATLAGDESTATVELIDFASKLFGVRFARDSVITEDRLDMSEYLTDDEAESNLPAPSDDLMPTSGDTIEGYIDRQCKLWFGTTGLDPLNIGLRLRRHGFLRTVLMNLEGKIADWGALRDKIAKWDVQFENFSEEDRDRILQSFLALITQAKRRIGDRDEPFLACQVQLWVREMSRMVRAVSRQPAFFWRDETPLTAPQKGLPAVYCRECGHSGWLGFMRQQDTTVNDNLRAIYPEYFERGRNVRYFFPGSDPGSSVQYYLDPETLTLGPDKVYPGSQTQGVPVRVWTHFSSGNFPKDMHRCPACETDYALTLVGSQAASLSSVAVSHLYQSPFNRDKKLLAFTDSVQDASHRAGFFAARTYRFNLRTAMQAVLEAEPSGEIGLEQFTDRMLAFWGERMDLPRLVATFLPPDLRDLPEYREFMRNAGAPSPKILGPLRKRLAWEVTMEFGFNARVGRTLDKVRCSTARLDDAKLVVALEKLEAKLPHEFTQLTEMDPSQLRHFIVGLLTRLKTRGGVSHGFLWSYAANQGKSYLLSKEKQPLNSPFGPQSRLPRFLSDLPNENVFDSVITSSNRRNWYTDWAHRCLSSNLDANTCNDVYRRTLGVLIEAGLLERIGTGNEHAYSIPPAALIVTRHTAQIRSAADGHYLTVAEEDGPRWYGQASLSYLGPGEYQADNATNQSYYRNIYRSGQVQRVFCHEHTGLLERETREQVEVLFKTGSEADAPNLLTCTPTLEMGIDVGDLSGTMVCSVPPTPTNYLQRIGRAGRATGNALILALANVKPHDLYFFDDPFAMIAGTVTTPGCFLDAPEMLKRQYLAFCLDNWATEGINTGVMPPKVMLLLAGHKKGEFPANFLKWYEGQKQRLSDQFLGLFDGVVSADNVARMQQFALAGEVADGVIACLNRTEAQIDDYRKLLDRVRERRKRIEEAPEKTENSAEVLDELRQEAGLLRRLIAQAQEKYPLNLFTDEGLLPNYAFPETGVKLKSIIYGVIAEEGDDKGQRVSQAQEYLRGASTAIRELAPFNTFYAEARKVVVDQVETGGRGNSQIEEWRFCNVCSHTEREAEVKTKATCPHCGSPGWADVGQRRNLLKLTQVSARSDHLRSRTSDESDERERKKYLLKDFIDIRPENWGGGQADEEGSFGFEYLKQVTLREVNFGPRDAGGQAFTAAGEQIPENGFAVCADCGIVRPTLITALVRHRQWCYYNQPGRQEEWKPLFLYRQVLSEAIRLLLPVSTFQVEAKLATFKACLELGLRRKFKGNPGHLIIREQQDPGTGGDPMPRRFLVLYDTVPGGTGYLKEFASNPAAMRDVLEGAFRNLKSCRCRQLLDVDGCYRCVYAYQRQSELEVVSRELGIEMLGAILAHWDRLKPVQFLSLVQLPNLLIESELESRFLTTLESHQKRHRRTWAKTLRSGKWCYEFEAKDKRKWLLEPQVELSNTDGIPVPCKPDFVLWPQGKQPNALPVAIFTDGFAHHVRPEEPMGGLAVDVRKRLGLIRSGKFVVWSLTWDDVDEFARDEELPGVNLLLDLGIDRPRLRKALGQGSDALPDTFLGWPTMRLLVQYLGQPNPATWRKAVAASLLVSMMPPAGVTQILRYPGSKVNDVCERLREGADIAGLELPTALADGSHLAKLHSSPPFQLFTLAAMEAATRLDPSGFQALLRIEDRQDDRQVDGYRRLWRRWLQTANLLQFLPGFEWVSAEAIDSQPQAPPPNIPTSSAGPEGDNSLAELLPFCDPSCHDLLRAVLAKGCPVPEIGFELQDDSGRVCAEAELAWPYRLQAVVFPDRDAAAQIFRDRGWRVFTPDAAAENIIC